MEVLGHRGSRIPGPENTVAAVDAALSAGADGVELDVRRSADGDLVCVHDARLPRLGGRAVIRRSTRELAERGIPLLHEVIDAWGGRGRLILEIKNQPGQPDFDAPRERTAQALIELLRDRGLAGSGSPNPSAGSALAGDLDPANVATGSSPAFGSRSGSGSGSGITVSSFDWFAIEAVRDARIGVATAFLTMPRMSVSGGLAYVRSAGHTELHAHVSAVLGAADAAGRARRAGVRLVTWTVADIDTAVRLRDAGVGGIICDDPAGLARALRGTGAPVATAAERDHAVPGGPVRDEPR